jgi:hypothetical protein
MKSITMKRRTFLTTTTAAAATLALPNLITAKTKKAIVLGKGKFQYTVEHGWGDAPKGLSYGNATHGVAVDKAGLIYITHQGRPNSIIVFEPSGKFVKSMGKVHAGSGHGIDIREENGTEYIYLSPSNARMSFTKMTMDGEVVWQKGQKMLGELSGKYPGRYRPTNASFSPDGGYFLGDGYGGGYIHQFDKKDRYVRTLGGGGTADGKFRTPHGQWLDARDGTPKLAVCDRANKRLQWFDMNGKHLRTQGGFLFPADIDIQGDIMMVPDLHARITLLDKNNKVITHLGDNEQWRAKALSAGFRAKRAEWQDGRFIHPHDACFDKAGNIYTVEWVVGGRVTKLTKV